MHLTLKQETASPPVRSLKAQIERFDAFRHSYNHDRPHEDLGQRPPIRCAGGWPRAGPLVPIGERESGGYDLHRLVVEKTVSVNTTAAGGNAALMSLSG